MAIQACSAAVTVLGPTSSSQPQLCCYGRIKTFFPSCRNTNLEKLFSEEERVFSISDRRPNYGFCFRTQALRSDHVDILKGSEALHAAKTIDVETMLGRSVIREGFSQVVTSSERHLENVACLKNQILKTGPLVRERELNPQNDVKFDVPHGDMVHFPKNMSSGGETTKIHAIGILTFASEMLFEDRNPSSAGAFPDIISDDSSIPNDTQSAESLPLSTEAAPNDVDSSVTIGDALVNVPSAAKEQKMEIPSDSPFSTDSLTSSESTVNSFSTDSLSSTDSTINSLSDTVSNTSEATSESFSETKNKINFSVEGAQKGFEEFFSNVKESLDSSLNSASSAAKSTYTDINSSILKSVKSLTGSFENAISGLFPMSDNTPGLTHSNAFDVMSPFQMGTPANNAIKKVVLVVEDSAGKVLATTASLVTETYRSTKALLPSEAKYFLNNLEEIASTIIRPLGSFIQQVNALITEIEKAVGVDPENPIIPVILVTGGAIFVGFSYWGYIYGGYAGDQTPKQAADLLRNERNTVLIDIRPQEMKESDGVPDLRRGERFKFAAVEFPKVEDSIRKLLRNANEIDDVLTAAVIRNLKIVNGDSKLLILDANGSQSKKVARALRKLGIKRSYRIKGGFQSWVADGLRVKEMKMETPLTILKEDTEAILEETMPTPGAIVAAFIGFVAAINALIEWEKTLQLIGFIGLAQVIYRRINSYETAEDLKADIRALLSPFRWASQGILSNSGQTGPSKLQLATSPSTTAVQNRVLQAAAKHSSISSEMEDAQDKEPIRNSATETDNVNEISQEEIRSQE